VLAFLESVAVICNHARFAERRDRFTDT